MTVLEPDYAPPDFTKLLAWMATLPIILASCVSLLYGPQRNKSRGYLSLFMAAGKGASAMVLWGLLLSVGVIVGVVAETLLHL